jgi:hypothetical protein
MDARVSIVKTIDIRAIGNACEVLAKVNILMSS